MNIETKFDLGEIVYDTLTKKYLKIHEIEIIINNKFKTHNYWLKFDESALRISCRLENELEKVKDLLP